jgi:DNA-binding response OmpR family regulator
MTGENALILIVDDEEDWRKVLDKILKGDGYQVYSVPSAAAAREWLAANRPNLIILDIMMPDGNGLDLCRWIRSKPELAKIPIILNSGIKDDETIGYALELGAVDFLKKPVDWKTFRKTIQRWLNESDAIRKLPEL